MRIPLRFHNHEPKQADVNWHFTNLPQTAEIPTSAGRQKKAWGKTETSMEMSSMDVGNAGNPP